MPQLSLTSASKRDLNEYFFSFFFTGLFLWHLIFTYKVLLRILFAEADQITHCCICYKQTFKKKQQKQQKQT